MPREAAAAQQELRVQPADFWKWVWASLRPVLGWVLAGAGLLLLLIAYLGVSREVLVAKQLPYLVSGGLSGLALVTFGSRLLLLEDLRRDSGRLDRLERMVEELHLALLTRVDSPVVPVQGSRADALDAQDHVHAVDDAVVAVAPSADDGPPARGRTVAPAGRAARAGAAAPRTAADGAVLVLRGGSSFHRQDCSVVAGKTSDALPARAARERGLRACRLCQPLAVTA